MDKNSKILVLGARGLVGSSIVRLLESEGYQNVLKPMRDELDLLSKEKVLDYFKVNRPEYIFLAAAKVGGILANRDYPADFIYQNLEIQNNVFYSSFVYPVKRLLFLGSSCIYPKVCPQPIKEEYLLTGELEKTNEAYAIAKIAGLKMAESFRKQYNCPFFSVMPTNLYGPNDNFDPDASHVIPGLIARMSLAKKNNSTQFSVWGTGEPRREFLYIDDMANGCVHLMKQSSELPSLINLGTGEDISIRELVFKIKKILDYEGEIMFDASKPDGTMKKRLDVSKIHNMGWTSKTSLDDGLIKTIDFFRKNKNQN